MIPRSCSPRSIAAEQVLKKAKAIEAAVFKNNGSDPGTKYRGKIRSLYVNLKDKNNPSLRESIVSGELTPSKFATMSSSVRFAFAPRSLI